MDIKRVDEIINSKGIIDVTYNNESVWIESVIGENETAHVKFLSSDKTMNVPVEDLKES